MKNVTKYILFGLSVAAFAAGMGVISHFERQERALTACSGMEIRFIDSLRFVSEGDVRTYIDEEYGQPVGECLDSVGLADIEGILESKSAVLEAEAWTSLDGILHIDISQRAPALRFMNGEKGFYIDDRGFLFPLHRDYTAPVPTVTGNIPVNLPSDYKGEAPEAKDRQWLQSILGLNSFISSSKSWRGCITSIEVSREGDIILTSRKGAESIVFGQATDIEDKFSRMDRYYETIAPSREEGYYNKVNVKYNSQIICRKDMLQQQTLEAPR